MEIKNNEKFIKADRLKDKIIDLKEQLESVERALTSLDRKEYIHSPVFKITSTYNRKDETPISGTKITTVVCEFSFSVEEHNKEEVVALLEKQKSEIKNAIEKLEQESDELFK